MTARVGRSQGILADAAVRVALERHAVQMAYEHYKRAGACEIEALGKPFDLRVIIDGGERHVEVKGSMGVGLESVQLTQGEVDHARTWQPTDLFVVDGSTPSGQPTVRSLRQEGASDSGVNGPPRVARSGRPTCAIRCQSRA